MKKTYIVGLIILLVLLLDQWLKFYVKLNFEYNEEVKMFGLDWARLHFVENEGMAFGITFDWAYGKLMLSLFRILMVGGLIWYIAQLNKMEAPLSLMICIGLITAGALGNIIDSAVYGLLFTDTPYHGGLAQLASADHPGYSSFLHGRVVDMLYFPMKFIHFPDWSPIWGGETVLFFSPIFNIADAAITTGVFSILAFHRDFFRDHQPEEAPAPAQESIETPENQAGENEFTSAPSNEDK